MTIEYIARASLQRTFSFTPTYSVPGLGAVPSYLQNKWTLYTTFEVPVTVLLLLKVCLG
jgi:hypothetical protein